MTEEPLRVDKLRGMTERISTQARLESILGALGEPTRRRIVSVLGPEQLSVTEIVELVGISQPAASKHLKVLREAGVIVMRPDAQRRLYRLSKEAFSLVSAWAGGIAGNITAEESAPSKPVESSAFRFSEPQKAPEPETATPAPTSQLTLEELGRMADLLAAQSQAAVAASDAETTGSAPSELLEVTETPAVLIPTTAPAPALSEPESEPAPEPERDAEPEPEPEPAQAPEPDTEPEPAPESEPAPEADRTEDDAASPARTPEAPPSFLQNLAGLPRLSRLTRRRNGKS